MSASNPSHWATCACSSCTYGDAALRSIDTMAALRRAIAESLAALPAADTYGNERIGERMRRYFPIDDDEDAPSAALPSSPPAQDGDA